MFVDKYNFSTYTGVTEVFHVQLDMADVTAHKEH
jgi:hypothetical protein